MMNLVFRALSDPIRRRILELLRQHPMSAGELSEHFHVSKPAMSAHFAVLREAGLVASTKIGKSVVYELQMSVLEDALLGFAQALHWDFQKSRKGRSSQLRKEAFNQ